jgi:hypothetical protein
MWYKHVLGGNKLINPTLEQTEAALKLKAKLIDDRIKSIKYRDIKRIKETPTDLFSYVVKSQNPKNQGEVNYFVYRDKFGNWYCDCPSFIYCKDTEKPTCKHILRVKNMIKESFLRQMRKAAKEVSK